MYRKAEKFLNDWKNQANKKALLVTGARQIGKTYLIRKFGRQYENFVEINFVTRPLAMKAFQGDLDADAIIMNLTALLGQALIPGKTLIFFDEIQECPEARTAIKFLVEDGRFDYIESGSLLGVQYKTVRSYPVGYESVLQMYPMDFEEFCIANGVQEEIFTYLRSCYTEKSVIQDSIHDTMLNLFRYYMIVGGMPDAVQHFIDTHDLAVVKRIQSDILTLYRQDISKYSEKDTVKITNIFDHIPSQLESKNRRFQLSSIHRNARTREYEDAFLWLKDAGVALPCYNLMEPKVPLKINEQARLFKLFLNDCGLICSASLENVQFSILQGDVSVNMGGILEAVFAQQLQANGFALRYYHKHGVGELDFVIQQGSSVIPIEIKSGKDYKAHRALNNALQQQEWKLADGIVFCRGNLEQTERVTYYPWYMVMFLKQEEALEKEIVTVDLSGLKL